MLTLCLCEQKKQEAKQEARDAKEAGAREEQPEEAAAGSESTLKPGFLSANGAAGAKSASSIPKGEGQADATRRRIGMAGKRPCSGVENGILDEVHLTCGPYSA